MDSLYEKSYHKKFIDMVKNKWIAVYNLKSDESMSVYYITGVRDNNWGGKAFNGFRIVLNKDNSVDQLDNLKNYDISLDSILYSVEIENQESIEYLDLQLAKHILL